MHPILQDQLAELHRLCRQYHVARLDVFGSATTDAFDPARSDLDFVVRYLPVPDADALDEFFGFKTALERLFGRSVDLVEEQAIRNPYFRDEVQTTRMPLYAA